MCGGNRPMTTLINTIAAIVFFGSIGLVYWWLNSHRRATLEALAANLDFEYDDDAGTAVPLPSHFHLLDPKRFSKKFLDVEHRIREAVYGKADGIRVYIFEFKQFRRDDNLREIRHGYVQVVGLFVLPDGNLPETTCLPAGRFRRLFTKTHDQAPYHRVELGADSELPAPIAEFLRNHPNHVVETFANEVICYRPTGMLNYAPFTARRVHSVYREGMELCRRLAGN